jgi:hypothetical protein
MQTVDLATRSGGCSGGCSGGLQPVEVLTATEDRQAEARRYTATTAAGGKRTLAERIEVTL